MYCALRDQRCHQHHDQAPHLASTTATEGRSVQQRKHTEAAYDADLVVVVCVHGGGMMEDNSNQFYKVWLFVYIFTTEGDSVQWRKGMHERRKGCSLPCTNCSIGFFCTAIHHCLTNSTKHNYSSVISTCENISV